MKIIRISSVWCTSCIITYKLWKDIQLNFPNNEYIEYDYDEDTLEVQKYNVGNILPVIIIFNNNEEIKRIVGEKSKKEIFDIINSIGE